MRKEPTQEQIKRAGQNIAMMWGASLIEWRWKNNSTIIYRCNECGEEFITEMDIADIQEWL